MLPGRKAGSRQYDVHTKMDSTVRYLGVELEDALAISEAVEI